MVLMLMLCEKKALQEMFENFNANIKKSGNQPKKLLGIAVS
jgi:hypothetical protein